MFSDYRPEYVQLYIMLKQNALVALELCSIYKDISDDIAEGDESASAIVNQRVHLDDHITLDKVQFDLSVIGGKIYPFEKLV